MCTVVSAKTDLMFSSNIKSETTVLTLARNGKQIEEIDWTFVSQSKKLIFSGSVGQLNKVASQMINPDKILGSHSNIHFQFPEDLSLQVPFVKSSVYHDNRLSSIEGLEVLLDRLSVSNAKTLTHPTYVFIKLYHGNDRINESRLEIKLNVFKCDETLPSSFEDFWKKKDKDLLQ